MKHNKKGNVLIVSNEESLQQNLESYFTRKHFKVFTCNNIDNVLEILYKNSITFAIFYNTTNSVSYINIANSILDFDNQVSIFFICDKKEDEVLIKSNNQLFNTISNPFSTRNLLTVLTNQSIEVKNKLNVVTFFNIGNYKFNSTIRKLTFKSENQTFEQILTKKEAAILFILCQNINKYVSKYRIMSDVWRKEDEKTTNIMDVYMFRLRQYLSLDKNVAIENLHGVGFRLVINKSNAI